MANSFPKIKLTAFFATALIAGFSAIPASAGSGDTVSVRVERADLATARGAERVYAKLKRTAEKACNVNNGHAPISQKIAAKECAQDLLDDFVRQVNSSRLSAMNTQTRSTSG